MTYSGKTIIRWVDPKTLCDQIVTVEINNFERITINGKELKSLMTEFTKIQESYYIVSNAPYMIGRIMVDPFKRTLHCGNRVVRLRRMLFNLFDYLCRSENHQACKKKIVQDLWNVAEASIYMYALNDSVYRLRKAIPIEFGITIDTAARGNIRLVELP